MFFLIKKKWKYGRVERMRFDAFNILIQEIINPREFFNSTRNESWKPSFTFFFWITLFVSLATAAMNLLGIESNDFSASYQSQIVAYNYVKSNLVPLYGSYAYILEPFIIFAFAILVLLLLTLILHVTYRLIGGQGSVINGWKATCYGIGPCLLGGFLPYISLFAAFYSFAMQFYLGPMILYNAKESRAIVVFTSYIALAFIEMFVFGTTVGW